MVDWHPPNALNPMSADMESDQDSGPAARPKFRVQARVTASFGRAAGDFPPNCCISELIWFRAFSRCQLTKVLSHLRRGAPPGARLPVIAVNKLRRCRQCGASALPAPLSLFTAITGGLAPGGTPRRRWLRSLVDWHRPNALNPMSADMKSDQDSGPAAGPKVKSSAVPPAKNPGPT